MQRVDVREDARDGIKYRQMKKNMFCLKVTLCEKLKSPDFLPDTKLQDLLQDVLPLRFLHDAHSFQLSVRQSHQSPPWTKHAKWIWRLKGETPGWNLTCTAGDTPKRATDNVFVPVEEQSVNGIQVQIPKAVQGRNIFFYKSIKRNCFTTLSFLCDRHLAWNFQLSPVQLTAKQFRLCINISTVYPLSKDPSQLFP